MFVVDVKGEVFLTTFVYRVLSKVSGIAKSRLDVSGTKLDGEGLFF